MLLTLHVIPKEASSFKAILANNLLLQADVSVGNNGIIVHKKGKRNFLMEMVIDNSVEEVQQQTNSYITNTEHEKFITETVKCESKEMKTGDNKITTNFKNEAVYQCPRRLLAVEKEEEEKQIVHKYELKSYTDFCSSSSNDITIPSQEEKKDLKRLKQVSETTHDYNLKIKMKSVSFCKEEMNV